MREQTKQRILTAFNRLHETMEISQITVDMILEQSGVSKATFYRYYIDKYDVMNSNFSTIIDEILGYRLYNNWKDTLRHFVVYAQNNALRLRNAYLSTGINSYESSLYNQAFAAAQEITRAHREAPITQHEMVQLSMFCYAITGIIRDWVNGRLSCSAEELTTWLYECMPVSIRESWS